MSAPIRTKSQNKNHTEKADIAIVPLRNKYKERLAINSSSIAIADGCSCKISGKTNSGKTNSGITFKEGSH